MRRSVKAFVVSLAVAFAMLASASAATADPTGAKKSFTVPISCDGQTLLVVVTGGGRFAAAHVIGSTATFIPETIDLTFTFTPSGGGAPHTETQVATKGNPRGDLSCDLDFTFTAPQGTFAGSGTVTGFLTPRGR